MSERPDPLTLGSFWNSGKARAIALGVIAMLGVLVMYKSMKSDPKKDAENAPKSEAVRALERMREANAKGLEQESQSSRDVKSPTDQPKGDPEATRLLADLEAKKEAENQRLKSAEDAVRAALEYTQFQRKLQGLPYNAALATAWEKRLEAAKIAGATPPGPPPPPSKESVQIVREKNPELAKALDGANSVTINVKGTEGGKGGGGLSTSVQGGAGVNSNVAAGGHGIPDGIDPKTGLPRTAIGDGGAAGHGGGGFNALLADGTPDLEGGAVPIQVQYTPPGSSQAITITRWIRPGYLQGRIRPYDPRDLVMEDQAFRTSMKAPTDLPEDKATQSTRIPFRMGGAPTKVHHQDFVYQNRHVVVLPNPKAGGPR